LPPRPGLSGLVSILPVDSLGGEVHAGGSVEIGAAIDAPQAELYRIEIDALGDRAMALELFFRMLSLAEPLVIGGGELRRIDEEGAQSVPVLLPVPWDPNGSNLLLNHEATITRAEPAVIPNDFHDLDPCGGLGGRCRQRLSRRGLATWSHATRFPDATCDGFGTALTKPYRKIDLAAKLRATLDSDP
jgi:hypothetical protein